MLFIERGWGTRGPAAAEKEETNVKLTIGFAGAMYLLINIAYMIVAVLYPLYFMWGMIFIFMNMFILFYVYFLPEC